MYICNECVQFWYLFFFNIYFVLLEDQGLPEENIIEKDIYSLVAERRIRSLMTG